MSRRIIGLDWGDIGRNIFSGVHLAGKNVASAFGFGGVANQLEQLESGAGLLKDWSKGAVPNKLGAPGTAINVLAPDYVVFQHADGRSEALQNVVSALVYGGNRFDGNGYKSGGPPGSKFSFGYNAPAKLDLTPKSGPKVSYSDVTKVLFLGGVEAKTSVQGDSMSANLARQILGEIGFQENYDDGDYVIGAAQRYMMGTAIQAASPSISRGNQPPRRAGFVIKTTANGRRYTALHIGPAKGHIDSIANARDAGKRAVSVGNKLLALTKKVHVVGTRPYTVAQLVKIANQAVKSGKNLLKNADVHEKLVKNLAQRKQAGAQAVQRTTHVIGSLDAYGYQANAGRREGILGAGFRGYDVVGDPGSRDAYGYPVAFEGSGLRSGSMDAYGYPVAFEGVLGSDGQYRGYIVGEDGSLDAYGYPVAFIRAGQEGAEPSLDAYGYPVAFVGGGRYRGYIGGGKYRGYIIGALDAYGYPCAFNGSLVGAGFRGYTGGDAVIGAQLQEALGDGGFWDEITGDHRDAKSIIGGSEAWYDILGDGPVSETGDYYSIGEVMDAYGWAEIVGDPPPIPDPLNPGFMTDQSVDPNYQGGAGGAAASPDGSGGASTDPSQNYGLGDPPSTPPALVPGQDYAPDPFKGQELNDTAVYDSTVSALPAGAVILVDPGRFGHGSVGSKTIFDGTALRGEGGDGAGNPHPGDDGLYQGGFSWHNDGWWFNWQGDNQRPSELGGMKGGRLDLAALSDASIRHHWGPLVGNPATDMKGLRYDKGANQWFWYRDNAPAWATTGDDQARLAKAILDYKSAYTAAAANAAAAAAQAKLDADTAARVAKQQAAEDAAQAHSMSIQQSQLDQQQAVLDQQNAQAQTQIDIEAQKAQMQQEAAQAQVDIQRQQYMIQHPEQASSDQDQGGGGGQGVDWGGGEIESTDDGSMDESNVDWGSAA